MRRRFISVVPALLISSALFASAQTPASEPTRVCVANLRNEIRQQMNVNALRDRLTAYLKNGVLSKAGRVEILALQEDTDQKAAPELRERRCDFAIYSRLVLGRVQQPQEKPLEPMPTTVFREKPLPQAATRTITGIQFTIVRVSSGIPVLIDRVFTERSIAKEEDVWPLLIAEQEKVDAELQKRLSAQKPQ